MDSNKAEKKIKRLNFVPGNRLGLLEWIQCKSPLAIYDVSTLISPLSRVFHQDITHVTFLQGPEDRSLAKN